MVRSGAISHLGSIEGELAKRGLSGFDLTSRCEWFANTLPLSDSIDRFLEDQSSHDDWISFLGKYSIAKIIGERERASYLNRRELPIDFARFSDTWLGQFWAKMNKGGGAKIDEKGFDSISFVVFNYDRCIEQFLYLAFTQYYQMDHDDAWGFLKKINIIHVYGSLGAISENSFRNSYGLNGGYSELVSAASEIKTFSESVDSEISATISRFIADSERVIFLGFSFAEMNRNILCSQPMNEGDRLRKVMATTYKESRENISIIKDWCNQHLRRGNAGSIMSSAKADEFFRENSLSLSMPR